MTQVLKSIPKEDLERAQDLCETALYPKVTFSHDMAKMVDEADKLRYTTLLQLSNLLKSFAK